MITSAALSWFGSPALIYVTYPTSGIRIFARVRCDSTSASLPSSRSPPLLCLTCQRKRILAQVRCNSTRIPPAASWSGFPRLLCLWHKWGVISPAAPLPWSWSPTTPLSYLTKEKDFGQRKVWFHWRHLCLDPDHQHCFSALSYLMKATDLGSGEVWFQWGYLCLYTDPQHCFRFTLHSTRILARVRCDSTRGTFALIRPDLAIRKDSSLRLKALSRLKPKKVGIIKIKNMRIIIQSWFTIIKMSKLLWKFLTACQQY